MSKKPRTCLVSKKLYKAEEMIRCTIHEGVLVWDLKVKNNGRGAYVHPSEENLKKLPRLKGKIEYLLKEKIITFNLPS